VELVGFATLWCVSTLDRTERVRIDLAWSWFDASNCPCKALRSGDQGAISLLSMQLSVAGVFFTRSCRFATLLRGSVARAMLYVLQGFVYKNHHFPSHVLTSVLFEHLLLRSDPVLSQSLPLFYILRRRLCKRT
jgi:hypothetical protein